MTVRQLFEFYKSSLINTDKRLILCNWKTQDGYEIRNIQEFEELLHNQKNELYILSNEENDDINFFEYFEMGWTEPYIVIMRHPLLTNAYWKEKPDRMLDAFAVSGGIYRYIVIEYSKRVKEYIIEFPMDVNEQILHYCQSLVPKGIKQTNESTLSIVFTNSTRFKDLKQSNFVTYNLKDLYTDWDVKNRTNLNLSRKLWNELKKIPIGILEV